MLYLKNEQECFAEVKTRGAVLSDVSLSSDCHGALHSSLEIEIQLQESSLAFDKVSELE